MRRTGFFLGLVGASLVAALIAWRGSAGGAARVAGPDAPVSRALPVARVVLFNTGLGFFQREGEVEGDARIDLSFPVDDVNDLLKSLVVEDGGRPGVVSYEGQEPLERMLKSFAFDLTYNPTFGQLLNQARGEKIEVTTQLAGATASTTTGTVVGMEAGVEEAGKESHALNLLAADGMRRVPLAQVSRVRFLDPKLDEEFRRALTVVAGTHNTQRRAVRVQVRGEGRRDVKIGYVVEAPIWKASYRLTVGAKDKAALAGFGIVENTTDEDWKDVRMVLVAGRPISYKMDLYQPLFLPRPTVEPRAFASLRPPTHAGAEGEEPGQPRAMPGRAGGFGGQLGLQVGGLQVGGLQVGGQNLGNGAGALGGNAAAFAGAFGPLAEFYNRYQSGPGGPLAPNERAGRGRLSYEDLLQRRAELLKARQEERGWARDAGSSLAALGEGAESLAATADTLGEEFSLALDQKVSLPRQMSALLPVVKADVEARPASLYNRSVHPRFPLRAVRLKNTTGQHLMQGPATVFDGAIYAGDTQLPDLQPGQEKLISYALDLGLEVVPEAGTSAREKKVKIWVGHIEVFTDHVTTTSYRLTNRSRRERAVTVEHPRADELVDTEKPAEQTPELRRFVWTVPAGESVTRTVTERRADSIRLRLDKVSDEGVDTWSGRATASKAVQDALKAVLTHRRAKAAAANALVALRAEMKDILEEQARLRGNIERLGGRAEVLTRHQDKLEAQERRLEEVRELIKKQTAVELKAGQDLNEFVWKLTVE